MSRSGIPCDDDDDGDDDDGLAVLVGLFIHSINSTTTYS